MASAIRKPTTVFGYNLCLPGALMPAIGRRIEELKSGNLSRYIVELVAFDLCSIWPSIAITSKERSRIANRWTAS
jgi:hypothetical protein